MDLHFNLPHGLVHLSAFWIFNSLVIICPGFYSMPFKAWILILYKEGFRKNRRFWFFFPRHKELLCYRTQWIVWRWIWTNKYFKLSIGLLVKSCRRLRDMKITQTDDDECFPRSKWAIAGIKTRKRILLLNLDVEENEEGQWFAICNFFFPHSGRKFPSGFGIYFCQTNLCPEKPIFCPKKIKVSSKYRLVMMTYVSMIQEGFNILL